MCPRITKIQYYHSYFIEETERREVRKFAQGYST